MTIQGTYALHYPLAFEAFTVKYRERLVITSGTCCICCGEVLVSLVDLWDNCSQQLPLRSIRRQEKNVLGNVQLLVKTGYERHSASGPPALINDDSTSFVQLQLGTNFTTLVSYWRARKAKEDWDSFSALQEMPYSTSKSHLHEVVHLHSGQVKGFILTGESRVFPRPLNLAMGRSLGASVRLDVHSCIEVIHWTYVPFHSPVC